VFEGFNGTIFAYGQTGSGKTHTMQGLSLEDQQTMGIIPRMVNSVFDYISETPDHVEFTVKCSMVEIYMEKIKDLFSPDKVNLKIREDRKRGVYIEDVTECYVSEEQDIFDLMQMGNSQRAISATNMNEGSSRSHMLFMLSLHQNNTREFSAKTGKLYLVDLAGSEKVGKTGAEGKLLEEAKKINLSLSSLGNVINALTESKQNQHIPYRDSKLTRILQESLGGNSRTTLIITCSPSSYNDAETLSTLRFGYRAKSIKNTPKINKEYTVAELQLLLEKAEKEIADKQKRIDQLEAILANNSIAIPTVISIVNKEKGELTSSQAEVEEGKASDEDSASDTEETGTSTPQPNYLSKIDEDQLRILENELKIEKENVRTQTEKINILRKEFAYMNAKVITTEKENENLIQKVADLTLKKQEIQETLLEKDMKIQALIELRNNLMAENEELKRSKEQYTSQLDSTGLEENSIRVNRTPRKGVPGTLVLIN
jgi:kinesin family member 5